MLKSADLLLSFFRISFELADWIYYNEAISIIVNDWDNDNWEGKVLLFLKKLKEEDIFISVP